MRLPLIILYLFFALAAVAQKQFNVLDWKTDVTLNTWLVQKMHEQYDHRQKVLSLALTSKKGLVQYQQGVRVKFKELVGSLPPKGPLRAQVMGVIQREGYVIEKLVYESFPDHHVTANFYRPEGKGPFPAALLFCGHEDVAKATESYQKTAILLARNGIAVLVIDPVSQSERHQLLDSAGKPLTRGGTTEHTLLNETSNLLGTSMPAYQLWDNIRSMDYLYTRKDIDTSRIGCIGNSGGAMQAIYYSVFDTRVKLVVPASYVATRSRTLELTGPADGCAQIPGEGQAGLEFSDYLMASAPKPILILAGRYDFIDYKGTVQAYHELKQAYTVLGHPQNVALYTYDDGHGISQPKREAAVTWFRKWFYNDSTPVKEKNVPVLRDKELFATATGQVGTAYAAETSIADRNLALYDSLFQQRKKLLATSKGSLLNTIRSLLSISNNKGNVLVERVGQVSKDYISYDKLILRRHNEVPLPVLMAYPAVNKKVIIWLHDKGKNKLADSTQWMNSYLEQGNVMVLADLRGIGETEDKQELNDAKYYNKEYRNGMLALHIGKPLVGQRVTDIHTILQFLESDKQLANLPIELHASGTATVPALHAAALFDAINRVYLYNGIKTFKTILQHSNRKDWYSYVIPNVLTYYDLPNLVKSIGAVKVIYK